MSEDETVTLDTFPILVKKEDLKSLAQNLQRIADWTGYLAGLFGFMSDGSEFDIVVPLHKRTLLKRRL